MNIVSEVVEWTFIKDQVHPCYSRPPVAEAIARARERLSKAELMVSITLTAANGVRYIVRK